MADKSSYKIQSYADRNESRVVALEVRPHRFGFIALEGANVLDCGSRSCDRSDANTCLPQRFRRILNVYAPNVIVMRSNAPAAQKRGSLEAELLRVGRDTGAQVVDIASTEVRAFFALHNAHTKNEIAHAVASLLPELAWKLPPERKVWESEHYRMAIFDAAALALAHIGPRPEPSVRES